MSTISRQEIEAAALDLNLGILSDADCLDMLPIVENLSQAYAFVDAMPDFPNAPSLVEAAAQRNYVIPGAANNPHNAWAVKCAIRGMSDGPLKGRRIAIKDSVMVAGLPMLSGSNELRGYIPRIDATVVSRILSAGGEIAGKTHCEYFCLAGGSHTNAYLQVQNPHRAGYTPGGSSTGSAAAVAGGEVEMAIGADQAGSIRMPSSFSGIVGMKPTYGLVPYTGIAPLEASIDHAGPMTATVAENALLLEVIAGVDEYDPRQINIRPGRYVSDLSLGIEGLRIGILAEGFGHANSQPDVDAKVRAGAAAFAKLGARVHEISVPSHLTAPAIWGAVALSGLTHTLTTGDGFGTGRYDLYPTDLMDHLFAAKDQRCDLPSNIKIMLLAGALAQRRRGYALYGKAINLGRQLRLEYDTALESFDALLMPTTPMKATPIPDASEGTELKWRRSTEMMANACPFNVTHHPALSIPCGMSDGLPVGMMLVARHFEESVLYRLAHAFEQAQAWQTR